MVSIMYGVANQIRELANQIREMVRPVFQPAEEQQAILTWVANRL
jgi:hypothetical protein